MRINTLLMTIALVLALIVPSHGAQGKNPGTQVTPAPGGASIVPGVSMGPIELGMTSAQMYSMGGPPSGSRTYDQLRQDFSQQGTPVDQYNLFINGFDTGEDFCTPGAPMSFGQVFYRGDRVMHIIISSWCVEGQMVNLRTAEGIGIGSTTQDVLRTYGKPDHQYYDASVGDVYDYLRRGITIILANEHVELIEIYQPE